MWVGHVLDYMPDHVLDHMIIGLVTTALQSLQNYCLNALILWCQSLSMICLQSGSWQWLFAETKNASTIPEATSLLKVLFDKVLKLLDVLDGLSKIEKC